MVRLDRIHHVGYLTDNLDEAIRRYGATFPQDEVVHGYSGVMKAKVGFVRSGDTWVELMEPEDKGMLRGQTGLILHHTAYEVADIDRAIEELRGQGVRFAPNVPTAGPAGPVAYFETDQLTAPAHLIQPSEEFKLPAKG